MALSGFTTGVGEHERIRERFAFLDFDFAKFETSYLTHGLHPYPAKFIPQIPRLLMEELSQPGDTVADIFCGSGTTLVEALLLGRYAVGVDANPLACLISRAKTQRLARSHLESLLELAERAERLGLAISEDHRGGLWQVGPFISKAPRPNDPAIAFWFEPFIIEELAEILSWCSEMSEDGRCLALVAFSSILVGVSKQDSDTRYVRRIKRIQPGVAAFRFARAVKSSIQAVTDFSSRVKPNLVCEIHQADVLERPPMGPVDLLVCSPPYPNAYSYHLYHKTRMLWLGMDPLSFKRKEIGSHRKYSSRGNGAATSATFKNEMSEILRWVASFLKHGGFACFVIGDSTIRGVKISNADLIADAADGSGLVEVVRAGRRLQATKKAFNPVIGKIKEEKIMVFQNSLRNCP